MAACKFLVKLIIFSTTLSFSSAYNRPRVVACPEEELDACSIKLFNLTKVGRHTRRYLWKTFSCTAALDLFAIARYTFWTDSWYNYSLGSTDPNNACGQVNSVTRNLAAIVPTCILGQSTDCSLKEKANNLGQAKYRVFITWDDYNCSGNVRQQTVSSVNRTSFPVVVTENDGRELLSLANNPTHVVDIDISHNYFGELILIVLIGYFISCSCCFCTYTVIEHKCCDPDTYKKYQKCRIPFFSVVMCVTCIAVVIGLPTFLAWFGFCPTLISFIFTMIVMGVGCFCCWPYIVYRCCCGICDCTADFEDNVQTCCCHPCCEHNSEDWPASRLSASTRPYPPVTAYTQYRLYEPLTPNELITPYAPARRNEPIVPDVSVRPNEPVVNPWRGAPVRPAVPSRSSYPLKIDRLAVKCTYKVELDMNETCAICLEEFTEGEEIRELPCLHVFHGGCVEQWLIDEYKHTCPLCKTLVTARRKTRAAVKARARSTAPWGEMKSAGAASRHASYSKLTPLLAAGDEEASVDNGATLDKREGEFEREDMLH